MVCRLMPYSVVLNLGSLDLPSHALPLYYYINANSSFAQTEKTTEAKMMKAGGTEIGKTLAEKSRGLFSANDWQCKT